MSIVVNTNIDSILVQRSLVKATAGISRSIERLSTGYRINNAADDAAGLTISEGLAAQARGSTVASDNAQTGINLLQTAEGDLSIIQDNLQRIRDLTVQAANGAYGTEERIAIEKEVVARLKEINRLANSSKFNSINLLNGEGTNLVLQIGPNTEASFNSLDIGGPLSKATYTSLGIVSLDTAYSTSASAASFLREIDIAIKAVSERRSEIGSLQNRLESTIDSLEIKSQNLEAAESRIRDVDIADEASNLAKNQILQQASSSLLAQANQAPAIALSLI